MKYLGRALIFGNFSVAVVWCATVWWWTQTAISAHRNAGLGAIAGGWQYLLQKPAVVVLLALSFGIGVYLSSKL